jgi:hypothetical protein
VISDQQLSAGLYYGLITERNLELAMQKKKVPEKRYRELTDQGLISEEAIHRMIGKEGYTWEDVARGSTKFIVREIALSSKPVLTILSDPTLDKRSYETLRKYILGIVKNKGPRSTSPLSTKIDFVKDSLNETGISVAEEEIGIK